MKWTDRMVTLARELYMQTNPKLSLRTIGEMIGGKSKNAVVGKLNRMPGLERRPSPIDRTGITKKPRQVPRVRAIAPLPELPSVVVIVQRLVRPPPPPPPRIVSDCRTCQWVTSRSRPWTFCDAPTHDNSSWCREHYKRVFQPA